MGAPRASQAVIRNAIQAAQECGVTVGVVEVGSDGSVRIVAQNGPIPIASPEKGEGEWDAATGADT